jgi:hypothetical protein
MKKLKYSREPGDVIYLNIDILRMLDWNYRAAACMDRIKFWSDRDGDTDGWFHPEPQEWDKTLGTSESSRYTIINTLLKAGLIEKKYEGKTLYFRPKI